ncbi:MAG TPA: hypothetical protein VFS29_04640 [Motilibacteraceae bacterium]|nr:hypothetical protein [Motilibacteraceae bacterium]
MPHPLLPRVALGGAVLLGASALAMPALAAGGQDPSGDNGTIKVHANAADDDPSNQPQVGCHFTVALFGFDAGEHGTLTLALQPPSGTRTLVSEQVLLSADAAGGAGNDPDEVYAFTASQLGVTGTEAVHVKLTVTADDAHGHDKHKVFWLEPCAATSTSSATATASGSASATATASESSSATATASESSSATATATQSTGGGVGAGTVGGGTATATVTESSSATATATGSTGSTTATATATQSTGGAVGGGTTGGGTGSTGGGGEVAGGTVGGVSGRTVSGGTVSGGNVSGAGVGAANVQAGGTAVLGTQYDTGTGQQGVLAHTGAAAGTVSALGAALLAAGAYLRRRTTRTRLQD